MTYLTLLFEFIIRHVITAIVSNLCSPCFFCYVHEETLLHLRRGTLVGLCP